MSEHITMIYDAMEAVSVAVQKINLEKLKFACIDISFWVTIFSANGMRPNSAKSRKQKVGTHNFIWKHLQDVTLCRFRK